MSVPTASSSSPPVRRVLRADQIQRGRQHTPEKLVTLVTNEEWELLVQDWAESQTVKYHTVVRIGGAGDEGRDVLGYTAAPNTSPPWDNYQCKFYKDPLSPAVIWPELGKLCYYTFTNAYTVPRNYRFVAPKDIGTKLFKLLEKPERLKAGLIANWDGYCKTGITDTKQIPLEGGLKQYVENFDFKIVGYLPVRQIVEDLRGTPHFVEWFGGGLPDRPDVTPPPTTLDPVLETHYVRHLLNAYGDSLSSSFASPDDLPVGVHRRHFDRSREHFYCAESLRVFSRATVPDGTFEALQKDVYTGVIDVHDSDHKDGFECVKATVKAALNLQIDSNALISVLTPADRSGICHQLANADKLIWVKAKP